MFPETVAIAGFNDSKVQMPSEVEVGGVKVMKLCDKLTVWSLNPPRVGMPGLTVKRLKSETELYSPVAACT